ncbi:hypothetical protein [Staphylococcus phage Stab20]|nr:hypothetical protein [Staphylococcus phage Stab20]
MKKGEKIVKEYYAVKENETRYFNNYWGYDYDITELQDMDTLMEDIETALDRKESEGAGTIQKIRVTYEVVEEEL